MSFPVLPTINAILNASAAFCLLGGRLSIASGRQAAHRRWMLAGLMCSGAFLASYLYYHYSAGSTRYTGEGIWRVVYFIILGTHTPLAGLMTPFILAAVWFAWRGRFEAHTRITRYLWPVWMYVSVTGVLIYLMLYVF